jgi:hypothetical protein
MTDRKMTIQRHSIAQHKTSPLGSLCRFASLAFAQRTLMSASQAFGGCHLSSLPYGNDENASRQSGGMIM